MRGFLLTVVLVLLLPDLASAQNRPPVVNAGPEKNAYTGVLVVLNGTATDPDGDPMIGWSWALEQAPAPRNYRLDSEDTANLVLIGYLQGAPGQGRWRTS